MVRPLLFSAAIQPSAGSRVRDVQLPVKSARCSESVIGKRDSCTDTHTRDRGWHTGQKVELRDELGDVVETNDAHGAATARTRVERD